MRYTEILGIVKYKDSESRDAESSKSKENTRLIGSTVQTHNAILFYTSKMAQLEV